LPFNECLCSFDNHLIYKKMSANTFISINPANGQKVAEYPAHSSAEIDQIISQASIAYQQWSIRSFQERSLLMHRLSDVLDEKKKLLSEIITSEMGKPMLESKSEIEKCALVCRYYAENAEKFLDREYITTQNSESFISYQPLGVVLAVMPWNFPFWQVFRFAAPALMGGNAGLLKHASNVMGSAQAIEDVFLEAGFPKGLFSNLRIPGSGVARVIEHPIVKAVTLTGSVAAGMAVAEKAGKMLKKSVLELGGSDPYIILEDADLEKAAELCVRSRLINGGQSCVAAKRFIVVENVYDKFLELFLKHMQAMKMGDPKDEKYQIGPQASEKLRDELHEQVTKSISSGAKCILGGNIPSMKGSWYAPTVLIDVKPGMPAWEEEMFGPVAAIIKAKDQADAIHIANDTVFGLGAAVFTRDIATGRDIAEKHLAAGCCFVNDMVKSDPRLPFGGIGHSGYGRELSHLGIKEFMNIKTVVVS
jgi:succinate-semialdehyde dehydrogenase / glutarate-semialdehyde dehydrogenase